MPQRAPTKLIAVEWLALIAAAGVAAWRAQDASWDLWLLATLLVLSIASDLLRIEVRAYRVFASASFLALATAAVFLGPSPAALAMFGAVILVFQYLVGALLVSQARADELELPTKQLAGFQVALLSALVRTLDLRDRMTARHSAAVARYSREIAAKAGLSGDQQDLAHTAGLLHDIGKFVLPDRILKGNVEL